VIQCGASALFLADSEDEKVGVLLFIFIQIQIIAVEKHFSPVGLGLLSQPLLDENNPLHSSFTDSLPLPPTCYSGNER
jgi:hypothetical protein